jgi:hypothetical protein
VASLGERTVNKCAPPPDDGLVWASWGDTDTAAAAPSSGLGVCISASDMSEHTAARACLLPAALDDEELSERGETGVADAVTRQLELWSTAA